MMKRKYLIKIIITTFLLFVLLGRFHFSSVYLLGRDLPVEKANTIGCGFWKSSGGGINSIDFDFIEFKGSNLLIKNDTLYFEEKPVAIAIRLVHRFLIDYELTLKSLDGKQTEYFVTK